MWGHQRVGIAVFDEWEEKGPTKFTAVREDTAGSFLQAFAALLPQACSRL
jgi:hypothetical protein